MPTYRSISITLHSQFNIDAFPEFFPLPQSFYTARGITDPVPPLTDDETSTCSVYIPVYPNSQFWLSYAVSPPVPADQHFLFKLYINGAHVVSWSAGREEEWKGKTMFALFEGVDREGRGMVERRVLCFSKPGGLKGEWEGVRGAWDGEARLEVRVHRASGRKRVEREVVEYKETEYGKNERGVSLVSAGKAGSEQPKRFYKFALIDPLDKPFATFRFYYRTWEQIRELGLLEEEVVERGESNDLSVIEPYEVDDIRMSQADDSTEAVTPTKGVLGSSNDGAGDPPSSPSKAKIAAGSPETLSSASRKYSDEHERTPSSPDFSHAHRHPYRLSVPPSHAAYRLEPPKRSSRPLPSIPQKRDPDTDTSYLPHPVFPVNEWETRTPSPVQSLRETISTPTMSRKRALTPTGWLNAIAGTWRRRGTPSNLSSDGGSRAASRSDSRGVQ